MNRERISHTGFVLLIAPFVLGGILQIVGVHITPGMNNGLWLLGTAGVFLLAAAGVIHLWHQWRACRREKRERRAAEIHRMACQPPDPGFKP